MKIYNRAVIPKIKKRIEKSGAFVNYAIDRLQKSVKETETFPEVMGEVIMKNKWASIKKLGLSGIKYIPKML